MTAIPSEEVVGGNGGGKGQMHGVASGFGRQATCGEEEAGQFLGVGADRCARKRGQDRQPAPDLFRVPPGWLRSRLPGRPGRQSSRDAAATSLASLAGWLL